MMTAEHKLRCDSCESCDDGPDMPDTQSKKPSDHYWEELDERFTAAERCMDSMWFAFTIIAFTFAAGFAAGLVSGFVVFT